MSISELETKADKQRREEIEYFNEVARLRKMAYEAHVLAGFTHDDSLAMCAWHELE